jgi:hypothetical protein
LTLGPGKIGSLAPRRGAAIMRVSDPRRGVGVDRHGWLGRLALPDPDEPLVGEDITLVDRQRIADPEAGSGQQPDQRVQPVTA